MKNLPEIIRKNNKTGVTGVAVSDRFYYSYIVDGSGKRLGRKFSLTKYGEDEAYRLAAKWRRDQELRIHGHSIIPKVLTRREYRHRQSVREAKALKHLKRMAAVESRDELILKFAKQKREYQKKAGKFIYRIDDIDAGHGWMLRIEVRGRLLCDKIFRDSKYGSPNESLRQAKKDREKQLKLHGIPYANGRRFSKFLRTTNSTGVTGVCRTDFCYFSFIPIEPNKTKSRKFSIAKYGEEIAFRSAVEWRKQKEIEVYGDTVLTDERINEIFSRKI
jgi:hypothetical protein